MILSKRERYVGLAAVAVLALLVVDRYAIRPLSHRREQADNQIALHQQQLHRAQKMIRASRDARERWTKMTNAGLRTDGSAAESRILNAVRDWAQDAGLDLVSVKPERSEQEKQFQKITFRVGGTGSMRSVSRFLWRIETASIPVRLVDVQISSRKDGMDDLSLQLGISTIYLRPEPAPRRPESASVAGEGRS